MSNKEINKDIWINSYPILIWLLTEPLAGLVDSRIAGLIGIDTLSSVGIGATIYFVFTWIFVFLAYGTTPLVAKLNTCLLYTSPSPRDRQKSRMPSSA